MRYFHSMRLNDDIRNAPSATPDSDPLAVDLLAMSEFLEGQKAGDVFEYRFRNPNGICDALIIATATSRRHAQGLADGILQLCTDQRREFLGMEGYDSANWILVDCNDIIIHIMQADARQLYRLEDMCVEPAQDTSLPGETRP